MESDLEKFRRRKHIEQKKEEIKTKLQTTANSWLSSFYEALLPKWNDETDEEEEEETEAHQTENSDDRRRSNKKQSDMAKGDAEAPETAPVDKWIMYLVILLRFVAWLMIYVGFLKIGFGAVFFTISLLFLIYWNTRKRKRRGEVSAYSVFNKDCQSIDGTLKAEHLEKQLLYRS